MASQLKAKETTEAFQACYNNASIPVQNVWQKAGASLSKTIEEPNIYSQFNLFSAVKKWVLRARRDPFQALSMSLLKRVLIEQDTQKTSSGGLHSFLSSL
ncbi:hypothetical protein MRX96_018995 [Rhipicephalus microplus]